MTARPVGIPRRGGKEAKGATSPQESARGMLTSLSTPQATPPKKEGREVTDTSMLRKKK